MKIDLKKGGSDFLSVNTFPPNQLSSFKIYQSYFYPSFLVLPLSPPHLRLLLCHCISSRSHLLLRSYLQLPAPLPLVALAS
jgi:hypothetical protein